MAARRLRRSLKSRVILRSGAITWGKTRSHALEMAQECIELHLEVLRRAGEPVPPGDIANEVSDESFVEVEGLATVV